jgi:PAS domain S-box-containing protein
MKAPLPENEVGRLAALHGLNILDTPAEPAYDELATLAAYICQTPIAQISLVDENRQWFKSSIGWTAGETPRDVAFCAHAILQADLLVVPDARTDERFATNPLVTSPPRIRFYAGAPLITTEGHALGSLCVLDHKPRELTAEQVSALRALSHQVVAQLRLHQQLVDQARVNSALAQANESLRAAISHVQRSEKALRESEQQLALAMRVARQGPWEADLVAKRLTLSKQIFGLPGESRPIDMDEFTGLVHPDDVASRAAALDDILAGRTNQYKAEYRMRDRSGRWVWVYSCGQVIEHDASGRPTRMIGMALDVTERKRAEEALRESERLLHSILGQLPGLAYRCLVDDHWTALFAAGQFRPTAGIDAEDLVAGRVHYGDILHPDDIGYCVQTVAEALARRAPFENEHRIFDRAGRVKWILSRGRGIFAEDGSLRFVEGLNIDITEQKRAEEELRQANERLALAVRGSGVGIWENDMAGGSYRTGRVHCTNIQEQLGYPATEAAINYEAAAAPIHPDDRGRVEQALRAYLAGETPEYSVEFRARHRDGSYRWILSRGVMVRDSAGRTVRFAGTRIDITERKAAEDALRQAMAEAEAASRAKSEFLAHVSHEIRTPLNALLGMNELALDTPLTAQQRKYLTVMQSAAEALLDVINDLLDFSRIEAGRLELDRTEFSLRVCVHDTLRSLALRAHRKELELVCRISPDIPDVFVGDAGRLRQVLTNLVSNAIKFTAAGEVVVEVTALAKDSEPEPAAPLDPASPPFPLHFSVRDTGIGIPRDKQQKIFEAFEQADSSMTRRFGGTGLGLSIASQLVGLMGGGISVESEPGLGSTFHFTVRCHLPLLHPGHVRPLAPAALHALPVLIVDDNATSRQTLEEWLHQWHMQPAAAGAGSAALATLQQAAAAGRPFALVLLDTRLPGAGAVAVAAQIRQTPELTTCGIILLVVEDQARELKRYHDLGIAACVMKPVVQEELLDAICRARSVPSPVTNDEVTGRQSEMVTEDGEEAVPLSPGPLAALSPSRRLHILVAEDNPFNQAVMEDLLPRRGHTLQVAADGRAALAALEQGRFDVLLLDIHMPELDGFQVIAIQRQREQITGQHLPVIALTARSADGERERCMQAGMDDYLAKPVRAAELFAAIDRVVGSEEGSRMKDEGNVSALDSSLIPYPSSLPLLEPAALLAACDADDELLRKLCRHFHTFVPDRLAEVSEALHGRNSTRLREATHKLGGLVSTFSATAAEAAAVVGRLGDQGKIEEALQAHARLTENLGKLNALLDTLSVEKLRHWHEKS